MRIKALRLWSKLFVSGSVSLLLALTVATGQQAEAVSDALIVQTLAPELDGVRLGSMENLDEKQSRKVAAVENTGFRFQVDLNSDGQEELVLLGDYVDAENRRSFVRIGKQEGGQRVDSQLLTFGREFAIGRRFGSRLAVLFCTGCDSGGWIEWTGSEYEFKPFPPAGVAGDQ
jgi:hypothetical protein